MRVFLLHSGEPTLDLLLERLHIPHGTKAPKGSEEPGVTIHWGTYHPDRGDRGVLQPVKSMLLAANARRTAELLELHGIDCAFEVHEAGDMRQTERAGGGVRCQDTRWSHRFVVPVFHLQALSLFHKPQTVFYGGRAGESLAAREGDEADYTEIGREQPSYYGAKAMREAVKAIYALGLDYGVVRIGVRPDGSLAVRGVEAVPLLTPRFAELFAEAINRYGEPPEEQTAAKSGDVMLGADPEFLLLNRQGKVTLASRFAEKDGPFGCDSIVLPGRRKIFALAELRPQPSTDVRELVIHLHRTMQLAAKRISDAELIWVAGGMPVRGFPLGGHIHFSGVELSSRLLRALDNYMALPLTLLEGETTGARKPRYGFLGDFRRKKYGGFEYRVLPSWMVSPAVTKGVLALAKLVAGNDHALKQRPLSDPEVVKAYYRGDKERIRLLLPALWRDLERIPEYGRHESYLLPLRRMMLRMKSWNEREDIRPKWKISPFR
ncbi:hypothetical protein YDYSG_14910 [Paenibacillus tyrfis]|uniref:putative amidoligase domain-containing protein n=1 Tax=Paenibacillus tyrfis TaxID=1501230 RepID=UPI0024913C30|nr:hypothetical protein [Paenibacillus tyrfis]GLI05461.1 hypothetical protein YDYSG_14910 [Paenibacillus tyrfis]